MSARPIHHGFLACVLTACSAGAPQKPSVAVLPRDWLADIRAQAAQADSAVQVVPLLDPGVADLRQQAQALESQGQLAQAVERWEQAIHLLPNDPELWQSLAETRIAQQRWREAEQAARQSYSLGPQVGNLCARNWLTVQAARTESADAVGAAAARAALAACVVPEVTRW